MSTPFYDLASLVVVPSGYKASKVYAQKPLTTDGQLTFSRASTATRVNSAGLIETVSSNVPRLDYLGSTCPKLLLEPQRTNLATYSEQLDNAAWQKGTGGTGVIPVVTANNATAPDGTMTADTVVFNAGAGTTASDQSAIYQTFGSLPAGTYTGSFYAKTASGTAQIMVRHAGGGNYTKFTITDQWQRFTSTEVNASTATQYFEMTIRRGLNEPINASATIQLWGFQFESGAYATSYVKTEAATVTRLADACSKTGISSLIGQTEGTLFVEMNINKRVDLGGSGPNGLEIKDTSGSNVIIIGTSYALSQSFLLGRRNAGSFSVLASTTNNALGTYKLAAAYSSAGFVFYVNGVQIGTSATLPPSATFADIGLSQVFGSNNVQGELVNQALLFKTRLTNAQLAELTTL